MEKELSSDVVQAGSIAMSEVIEEAVIVTEGVVENNDTVNVVDSTIANAPEVTSPTAGPGVTDAPATVVIDTKATRTRSEDTIKRQILTNVIKHLTEIAANKFKTTGKYSPPSKEDITALCKKRWQDRLDRINGKAKEDVSMYF